jgi:hypothetical protein
MTLTKIVSGGETGVDRAALDAALAKNFPCGGWLPEGRKAEDGAVPEHYPLIPLPGGSHRQRTLKNVHDSDGTLILFDVTLSGGTKLVRDLCIREKKPFVVLDAAQIQVARAIIAVVRFVEENDIEVLNVAGPRAGGWKEGYEFALAVVGGVISRVRPT